jgi:hypothetical protein
MGYYTRVFCKADGKPALSQVLNHINNSGLDFKIEFNLGETDQNTTEWKELELIYKTGKLPILVEYNSVSDDDGLAKEEIEEFLDEIGEAGILAFNKKKIVRHLQATKYIVVTQLPTSDIDDDGYNANGELLKFFVDNYEGVIQADGEGFYEGTKIILKTE